MFRDISNDLDISLSSAIHPGLESPFLVNKIIELWVTKSFNRINCIFLSKQNSNQIYNFSVNPFKSGQSFAPNFQILLRKLAMKTCIFFCQ